MKQSTRGGKRQGAGRKAHNDKKEAIFIYIPGSMIAMLGGREIVKRLAEKAIERKCNNVAKIIV